MYSGARFGWCAEADDVPNACLRFAVVAERWVDFFETKMSSTSQHPEWVQSVSRRPIPPTLIAWLFV